MHTHSHTSQRRWSRAAACTVCRVSAASHRWRNQCGADPSGSNAGVEEEHHWEIGQRVWHWAQGQVGSHSPHVCCHRRAGQWLGCCLLDWVHRHRESMMRLYMLFMRRLVWIISIWVTIWCSECCIEHHWAVHQTCYYCWLYLQVSKVTWDLSLIEVIIASLSPTDFIINSRFMSWHHTLTAKNMRAVVETWGECECDWQPRTEPATMGGCKRCVCWVSGWVGVDKLFWLIW